MAVNAKKLKAFADQNGGKSKFGKVKKGGGGEHAPGGHGDDEHDEEEHDEHAEHEGGEGKDKNKEGKDKGGDGKNGDGKSDKKVDVKKIVGQIKAGKGEDDLMELAEVVNEENDPPAWAKDEDKWEKAKKIAGDSEQENYYAVVAHVYKALGGKIEEEHDDEDDEEEHDEE